MRTNSALKVLLINPAITMGKFNYASGTRYPPPLGLADHDLKQRYEHI